ncbi:MAG: class I SAM-dependent rRNA methyltransferase [Verrucomicrobiales bacterium]|nr:class I SAM-dependent rRNA methyltransferase [Verrucomicrobiales bacterium]
MAGIVIKPRSRIYHGHDWVYASEIQKVFGEPQPGDLISLKDFKDRPLGTAIYNPDSQIVARRISRRKEELTVDFFVRRIERALKHRQNLGFVDPVYRLVWSEADGLPGVVIDRYDKHIVLQTLTLAMDQRKMMIVEALNSVLAPESVIERNDSPVRKAEGLEPSVSVLHGTDPGTFRIDIGDGILQEINLVEGQKTGIYLDQLDNYATVAHLAPKRSVLDCCTNQGGFALHCAKAGAASVRAIDISESAIESTRKNAEINELNIDCVTANVFDYLKKAETDGEKYDLVILDPPSFTRNRKKLHEAMRGYKEIHLRALKILNKDGILATFCCSHHVTDNMFHGMICDASVDAKRTLRLVDHYGQRQDHPVIATMPETSYLKGYCFQTMGGF